jgi:Na+/H+ antiporter NhaD/arsenite permease-like protein
LDNAPTYVAFASLAMGSSGLTNAGDFGELTTYQGGALLKAISCGAVFLGAMTYIGNGPNFMVKSIAEASGVRMPGFFGYVLWSCGLLLPILALCCWVFFI